MKRPEYVAGVVDNYRKAVDKVILKKKYNEQEGKGQLLQLFNRSGFTNAYLKSNTGKDMMSFNSPKKYWCTSRSSRKKMEKLNLKQILH